MSAIRIGVAGFSHETNTFAPWPTGLPEFEANGYFRGEELLTQAGTNTVIGGMIDAIGADSSIELLPIVATSAIPGGLVTAAAAIQIDDEIAAGMRDGRPDAVVLDLHGAMVTELSDDGEAATLRKVREAVGSDIAIVAVLDLHANISREMVELADALIPYDTYPHIDNAERGAEAVALATRAARGDVRLTSAMTKIPMMPPGPKQYSQVEPTISIMARAFELERLPGVLNVGRRVRLSVCGLSIRRDVGRCHDGRRQGAGATDGRRTGWLHLGAPGSLPARCNECRSRHSCGHGDRGWAGCAGRSR